MASLGSTFCLCEARMFDKINSKAVENTGGSFIGTLCVSAVNLMCAKVF